jgi:hypothetical protein
MHGNSLASHPASRQRSSVAEGPVLVVIVGPGAVGRMTVGREVADRAGFPLLHNHVTAHRLELA